MRGHLHEARITVIDGDGRAPRHLNKHITALPDGYRDRADAGGRQGRRASRRRSRMAVIERRHGSTSPAFGSSEVGVFDTSAARERHVHARRGDDHIAVTGGGPSGLVLDEADDRLYVLTRFDNAVKVDRHRRTAAEIARIRSTTRSLRRSRERPAGALRRALHLEQRRGVVRELPRVRRLRQPRVGSRQSRRRRR